MLRNVRIPQKILAIVALGIVCIAIVVTYGLFQLKNNMIDDRRLQVKQIVEEAVSIARHFRALVEKGVIDDQTAQQQAKTVIRDLAFGGDKVPTVRM